MSGANPMRTSSRSRALARWAAPALAMAALLGGCARADKKEAASTATSTTAAMSKPMKSGASGQDMAVMGMAGGSKGGGSKAAGMSVDGIKPVPMQTLGTTTWEGMKIAAQAMTAVPFTIYNGTSERMVKPGKASFHLMVFLSDAHTGAVIPYASVWATIRKQGKVVFDQRQWPMIARYMGPHYGNDVTVPGPGTYQLSLLISPPVSARHVEYDGVWMHPHRVDFTFHWHPA
jgi:Fe2+ transport protein